MREYFTGRLQNGTKIHEAKPYKNQINKTNMMGFEGKFANSMANVLGKMWDVDAFFSVWPLDFKKNLGKINDQFQGMNQHDSHEFLSVIMGALHEEVNIRMSKPYIENPENRPDTVNLSYEFWANFLRRNWSVFVFIFYGQIRSALQCEYCKTLKVIYEPFSVLSLPVPNANSIQLPILVFPIALTLEK